MNNLLVWFISMHPSAPPLLPDDLANTVGLQAPLRRQAHASRAMDQVDTLFEWIGDAQDPVLRLFDAAHLDSVEAGRVQGAWSNMVRAHAMDTFADAGLEALAWQQAIAEGVYTLITLSKRYGAALNERKWHIQVPGLTLSLTPHLPGSPAPRVVNTPSSASFVALTMADVARELSARPASQCLRDAEEICDFLPSANLPVLAVGTGALLALATAGRLTGYEQMSLGGGNLDWVAHLVWTDVAEGQGPTGEVVLS